MHVENDNLCPQWLIFSFFHFHSGFMTTEQYTETVYVQQQSGR